MTDIADLVRLVGLESMLRIAVLVGVDGYRADTEFIGRTKSADRDLSAIGHQHFGDHP
jgi:hypothetical protein